MTRNLRDMIEVQADGKIIVAGQSGGDFLLMRYNMDGTLDTTFATADEDGWIKTDFGTAYDGANSVVIQGDGKIVVGGGGDDKFALARYTAAGVLDSTFDGDGKQTTSILGQSDSISTVAIDGDGDILAAGYAYDYGAYGDFGLAKYKVSNGLDERVYVQQDANYNVTSITDAFGAALERYIEDPYGTVTVLDPNWSPDATDYAWVYLHQGLRYDPISEDYDNRTRPYDPSLGRFKSADIGYLDSLSLYQYVTSNPDKWVDPIGRQANQELEQFRPPPKNNKLGKRIPILPISDEKYYTHENWIYDHVTDGKIDKPTTFTGSPPKPLMT